MDSCFETDNEDLEPFLVKVAHNRAIDCLEHLQMITNENTNILLNAEESGLILTNLLQTVKLYFQGILQCTAEAELYSYPILKIIDLIPKLNIKINNQPQILQKKKPNQLKNDMIESIKNTQVVSKLNGLNDIAGHKELKKQLKLMFILPRRQPQLFIGQQICRSVLLYGPPGVGKTQFAYALAAEAKADLYFVSASTLLSSYIGETEKMIEALFSYMKTVEKVSILFIDEVDGLCRKRNANETDHSRRLKTELLLRLSDFGDNTNSFLICATNCPWDIDTGFLRRFQKRLYVALPNRDERLELFQLNSRETPLYQHFLAADNSYLLELTEGFSGSDIHDLFANALSKPITELDDIKVWKLIENKYYVALNENIFNSFSTNLRFCSLDELPENSVLARNPEINDVIEATKTISCTVSSTEIQKFHTYFTDGKECF